jgi:hypothetical protein
VYKRQEFPFTSKPKAKVLSLTQVLIFANKYLEKG